MTAYASCIAKAVVAFALTFVGVIAGDAFQNGVAVLADIETYAAAATIASGVATGVFAKSNGTAPSEPS